MGLSTLLGKPQGFFIPYRYAGPANKGLGAYPEIERLFKNQESRFANWLQRTSDFAEELTAIGENAAPPEPRWSQGWFPRLDAAMAYVFVRSFAPKRLIEVGSGHSTRFCLRALRDGALPTAVTAIDPAPRADLSGLPLTLLRQTLQQTSPELFDELDEGDIVMIDSSHILMPGTDLDYFFGRVLPRLPNGVLLHVHDIFLPDGYPASWAWRGYNEQLALLPLLLSPGWQLLFSCHYAATRMVPQVEASVVGSLPRWPDVHESSLWLRKVGLDAASRDSELP